MKEFSEFKKYSPFHLGGKVYDKKCQITCGALHSSVDMQLSLDPVSTWKMLAPKLT